MQEVNNFVRYVLLYCFMIYNLTTLIIISSKFYINVHSNVYFFTKESEIAV